jgi:hypothetical protein
MRDELKEKIKYIVLDNAEADDWMFRAELLQKHDLFLEHCTRDIMQLIDDYCDKKIEDEYMFMLDNIHFDNGELAIIKARVHRKETK